MPWTFSHPAAVLPIKHSKIGKFLNLPALVIGSLSPDLFYSVGLYQLATKAHNFSGWFYTGLPVCIFFFILISWLYEPLTKILPIPLEKVPKYSYSTCCKLVFSFFIGAATHILWDGFTHETGAFVRNLALLQYPLFHSMTNNHEIRVYKLFQYLSSLLGVLYLWVKYSQYQHGLTLFKQKENKQKLYRLFKFSIFAGMIAFPFVFYCSQGNLALNINKFVFNELRLAELVFFVMILMLSLKFYYQQWRN